MKEVKQVMEEIDALRSKEAAYQERIDQNLVEGKDEDEGRMLLRSKLLLVTRRQALEWVFFDA